MVFLDEATSALDSKAEVVVQAALDKMVDENASGCTLIIAHRLSTLRTCNRIIVMDKGCIKESGSHCELMSIDVEKDAGGNMIKGWYRDLYETQHGKGEGTGNTEKLEAELAGVRQELEDLREENSQLREDTIKNFKLGRATRMRRVLAEFPPVLNFTRHVSENSPHYGNDENSPPLPLNLNRAKTTFNW